MKTAYILLPALSLSLFACAIEPVEDETVDQANQAVAADETVGETLSSLAETTAEQAPADDELMCQGEGNSVCKATPKVTMGNPPAYVDVKKVLATAKQDGDCAAKEPCLFDVEVLIRPDSPFDPMFAVGIVYRGMVLTQTINGMWGAWKNIALDCGTSVDFDIQSYRPDIGISQIANVKLTCEQCPDCLPPVNTDQ